MHDCTASQIAEWLSRTGALVALAVIAIGCDSPMDALQHPEAQYEVGLGANGALITQLNERDAPYGFIAHALSGMGSTSGCVIQSAFGRVITWQDLNPAHPGPTIGAGASNDSEPSRDMCGEPLSPSAIRSIRVHQIPFQNEDTVSILVIVMDYE